MTKLRLHLDDLAVETFQTGDDATSWRGTVEAHAAPTLKTVCDQTLLGTNPTCCPCTPMM
jgi:hypothetical protein